MNVRCDFCDEHAADCICNDGEPEMSEAKQFGKLLDEFVAHDHRKTADHLEEIRLRLGLDGLSMGEWNALVGAASHLRVEAWRREDRAQTPSPIEAARADERARIVAWLRSENGLCDCFARSAHECGCGAWDDYKQRPLLEIADAIESGAHLEMKDG